MSTKQRHFVLYWLDGKSEVVRGVDIAAAMTARGYGHGALGALDFYSHGPAPKYVWDAAASKWVSQESRSEA